VVTVLRLGLLVRVAAAGGILLSILTSCDPSSKPAVHRQTSVPAASRTAAAPTTAPGRTVFTPGAAGVGDPYFPLEGNGGYDVSHYDLNLNYVPATHLLSGVVTITAKATQNLSRFDVDLSGMTVARVRLNSALVPFSRSGQEFRITAGTGLISRSTFTVAIRYAGMPKTVEGSPVVFGAPYGWIYTKDGAFVGAEPNAASTWFPSNDHPSDKATFSYQITVPHGTAAMANGDLMSERRGASVSIFKWRETSPMATYLATIDIGKWTIATTRTAAGIKQITAYDPTLKKAFTRAKVSTETAAITDYWQQKFGPYPFTSTGAIVDSDPHIGFSLETQTRPLYGFCPDRDTVAHELAHEWFGDSVSVASWRDIWLNEGFATFAQNLWDEHVGAPGTFLSATDTYNRYPAKNRFWDRSIADPGRDSMFSAAVYSRGFMTLAVLRHKLGDATFFSILRQWATTHRYANATTTQFIALVNRVSRLDLTAFFQTWLYAKVKPPSLD
jgi:aminopeptidase N